MNQEPFIEYLAYFHGNYDYFHCHDILEDYWKTQLPLDKSSVYVGFIQLAVGLYHFRANNLSGAERMLSNALKIFNKQHRQVQLLGIDFDKLTAAVTLQQAACKAKEAYQTFSIPIADQKLLQQAISRCHTLGFSWQTENTPVHEEIIYKHKLRDRSEIIAERTRKLNEKKTRFQ